jgi:hypothetical protein
MPLWTAPRTWTVGEIVTDAELNANIRDNLLFLRAAHACRAFLSADVNVAGDSLPHAINLLSESFDTDGFHDPGFNPSRFTIPTGLDGYYYLFATTNFESDAGGTFRDTLLRINNAFTVDVGRSGIFGGGAQAWPKAATIYRLIATDYVELCGRSDAGHNVLAKASDTSGTHMGLIYLGL